MSISKNFKYTRLASYIGYVTQAIVNNLAPLLFVTFSKDFGFDLESLSLLITINFSVQILVDALSAGYIMKLGYRRASVLSHILAGLGLVFLGTLPFVMDPFLGLSIAIVFMAVGGGIDEVIISPIVEAIPGEAKEADMSLLHSFYSWGQMLVVLGSTLFFAVIGIENWRVLPFIWAVIPFLNAVLFIFVPIRELCEDEDKISLKRIVKNKEFRILFIIMLSAGASELGMSQWASLFAEEGLGVSKTMGDLLGPMSFAFFMGISRTLFGIKGSRMNLERCLVISGILCFLSYLITGLLRNPIIALSGCGLCGFSVGLLWPGTYSIGAKKMPWAGAKMFALLAFAGDLGCTSGPDVVGFIGNYTSNIKKGLLAGSFFPLLLVVGVLLLKGKSEKRSL